MSHERHQKLDRMMDLNPFFPQIKRLLKMDSEFREYGIELLKATLKFEVGNATFNFHLFDDEGEELVSLKIENNDITVFNHQYDKQSVKQHLNKRDKSWTIINGIHLRHTPGGAGSSDSYKSTDGIDVKFNGNTYRYMLTDGFFGFNGSGTYVQSGSNYLFTPDGSKTSTSIATKNFVLE